VAKRSLGTESNGTETSPPPILCTSDTRLALVHAVRRNRAGGSVEMAIIFWDRELLNTNPWVNMGVATAFPAG